jgi:hypothetical protein
MKIASSQANINSTKAIKQPNEQLSTNSLKICGGAMRALVTKAPVMKAHVMKTPVMKTLGQCRT